MTHLLPARAARPSLLALIAAVLLSAVGGLAGPATAAAAPTADLSATIVDFGYVRTGTVAERTVTLTNNGDATLTMTGTVSTNSSALTVLGSSAPLPAGESRTITFRFAPTSTWGAAYTTLRLNTNAPGGSPTGVRQIQAAGSGAAPVLSASSNVFIGQTAVGQTRGSYVTVSNQGNWPLTISAATVVGTHAAEFSVDAAAALASPIPPNQSRSIAVTFSPTSTGSKSASLQLTSDATTAVTTIPINASGT